MPRFETTVSCPVHDSFRVQQIGGMFDVPVATRSSETFTAEIPSLADPWQIGLIVGPSGSGKSTMAREAFAGAIHESNEWPHDRAIVDCFDDSFSTQQITRLLTAVGFSSPPTWIKPYQVLSGGERFRCDLARALSRGLSSDRLATSSLSPKDTPLVVFDEFTSVVDRTVAKIGSAAVAKALRQGHIPCRFIAVTCHYDVAEWLAPDWIVDMASGELTRRRLRRPSIELHVHRCRRNLWPLFARHHYLSGDLSPTARCYLAHWQEQPIAFAATIPIIGRREHWRITRLVTLPDYQGIGIGMKLAAAVAEEHRAEGHRLNITASHPSLIAHCQRSSRWFTRRIRKSGTRSQRIRNSHYCGSPRRAVVSFEYVGAT